MRFEALSGALAKNAVPSLFISRAKEPSFGIAFDIDGVILRGRRPIGGSLRALRKLYDDKGNMKIPFLFLTNGGGTPESRRAAELSDILGVNILPSQVVQGHSAFRSLLCRYETEPIVATGKGEPALVMAEYGFKKVLGLDEYASYFMDIDPVSHYKTCRTMVSENHSRSRDLLPLFDVHSERVKAAFVISDPVDWGRDIQVLCDILRSGGLPGKNHEDQPALFFAADDLEFQAAFPAQRLGSGAFRIALQSVFDRVHHTPLNYTSFGKPNPLVFKNSEAILKELYLACRVSCNGFPGNDDASHSFEALYMIGDNPAVDIKGAKQAGHPWISILTRTGVFRGERNDCEFPADMVTDTVEEAVDYISKKECM